MWEKRKSLLRRAPWGAAAIFILDPLPLFINVFGSRLANLSKAKSPQAQTLKIRRFKKW